MISRFHSLKVVARLLRDESVPVTWYKLNSLGLEYTAVDLLRKPSSLWQKTDTNIDGLHAEHCVSAMLQRLVNAYIREIVHSSTQQNESASLEPKAIQQRISIRFVKHCGLRLRLLWLLLGVISTTISTAGFACTGICSRCRVRQADRHISDNKAAPPAKQLPVVNAVLLKLKCRLGL